MAANNKKSKLKRLPKGQRTYTRRLKQEARKEIKPNRPQSILLKK